VQDDAQLKHTIPERPHAVHRSAARYASATAFLFAVGFIVSQPAHAAGDTRTISLHHIHTKETVSITYKKNGAYDEDALKKINWALRDWRTDDTIKMDPLAIDLLWEIYQDVGAKEPIQVIGGYRSPGTNAMLRNRSKGVARHSQHMLGKAIDFYIPGVPIETVRAAGMRLQGGGVGYYPTSGSPFVHLDVGSVRAWPRMTREQLVKLFPDGRTVHIPADGTPLPGYQMALAELERGQRTSSAPPKRSFLASLFGGNKDTDEVEDVTSLREAATASRQTKSKPAPATPSAPARTVVATASAPISEKPSIPTPPRRPLYQVAAVEAPPVPSIRAAQPINLASLSPNQIIQMRGLWDIPADPASGSDQAYETPTTLVAWAAPENRDITASIGTRPVHDRPGDGLIPAYSGSGASPAPTHAVVITRSGASIVHKPVETPSHSRVTQKDRHDDPWMRGLMLAASAQNSLVVTPVGDSDMASLTQHMRKPAATIMMTFSRDPHDGTTTDKFTGSAVVFQSTMTFSAPTQRTAALR
jgi:uncharacterized protein YcbK (DUF882 family)